jgi:hypothetical protein
LVEMEIEIDDERIEEELMLRNVNAVSGRKRG